MFALFLLQNVKGLTGAGAFEHLLVFQNQRLALNMGCGKIGYIKIKRGFYKNWNISTVDKNF